MCLEQQNKRLINENKILLQDTWNLTHKTGFEHTITLTYSINAMLSKEAKEIACKQIYNKIHYDLLEKEP